ncbi:MAG: hypothetical protein Q7R79_05460 [bacterium]|nr:hypothetical protein [bacterium]
MHIDNLAGLEIDEDERFPGIDITLASTAVADSLTEIIFPEYGRHLCDSVDSRHDRFPPYERVIGCGMLQQQFLTLSETSKNQYL